jgi:glycerol-3-phosphate dehydrogenase
MSRLESLSDTTFDLVIIGGGIIGAGIARDAAMRGLSVALFEKADYGGGTTAGSTRLIHGGLRYLEMLDFGLVRTDLREREILLRIAPHLVKPMPFVLPFYRRSLWYRQRMRIGLFLYDILSFDKSLPSRRNLSADQVREQEPHLNPDGLQGAASYYDAQARLPERLCVENIIDAAANGARTFNYAEVSGALHESGRLVGVRVRDILNSNKVVDVRAKFVVNASGPWFDRVARVIAQPRTPQIRTTKGIHIAHPSLTNQAMALFSPVDDRLVFVIPWLGYSWIGTTDTDYTDDPSKAYATPEDVDYVVASVKPFFPEVDRDKILFTNAGVRALVMDEGSESSVSRQHRIVDNEDAGAPGLIAILGSKLTAYRAIAEETTDRACRQHGVSRKCRTADEPLPGARTKGNAATGVDAATFEHLVSLYGTRAEDLLLMAAEDPTLRAPLAAGYRDIVAQVRFAVREEQCARLVDFMFRRTRLGFTPDQGRAAVDAILALMAAEHGWSDDRAARERAEYDATIARTQAFRRSGER